MWALMLVLSLFQNSDVRTLCLQQKYESAIVVSKFKSRTPEMHFWKSVALFKLNKKEEASSELKNVLEPMKPHNLPERYMVVASMMKDELDERWSKDDLDNTARKMDNVQRRLELGLAKSDTLKLQKEIIDDLDKKIKDAEDQINKQNQQAQSGGQQMPSMPVPESKIMQGQGDGKVDNKKLILTNEVWGKMPPKNKEIISQSINRQLPAHIREAAEGFSKKLSESVIKK